MTDNRIGVARVWILPGNTWSESGWVEERRLIPLSSMSLPSAKGNASFQLLRSLRDDGDGVGMVNDPGMIVPGHWIAVTFGVDAFSFAEVEWWGFIKRSSGVRVEGGDIRGTVEALEVGHLLEDSGVSGWQCATGTGSSYEIEDAPTWNLAHKGGQVVGNIVDVDSVAVLARASDMGAGGTARVGTRLDLLLHVLTFCSPRNLPAMWADPGNAVAILNDATSPEVLDVREAKFCGAIDLCVPRTRSVAWTVVPESAGWEIACWKDPSDSGNNIDLDSLDETEVRVDEAEEAVDEVVVEGGPIIYCGSLSYQDSNLDQGWTAAQETTWKTAVAQNGGENLDDYVERVAQFRSKASLAPVFTRFNVPDVNGSLLRSLDPGDGSATLNFFPKILWDGYVASLSTADTVDPYWPTTEILRWIPVQTDGGDSAQQQWAKPKVFRRDASASAPLDGPVWVDLTADWKKRHGAAIDIGDQGPSISVKFSPPEILAKGHWSTGSPAPAKLDKLGFATPDNASVPSHARCIDWQTIVATVAIPGGQRLRVTKWRDGYTAATARRSLLIRNDKLQLWVLHQGTVLDAGNGATPTKQAAVGFPRNDYATAERIATEAAAWAFRARSAITIEMPRPDDAPAWASLGYPIADVQDGGTTYECNTCVGSVAIDWSVKRPRITISTVFPERPAAGSGSASPTGGGSVSSALGGTVAQSARSSAAAVASIVQAAQQIPLIAPRPRAATEPEPLFWMVSQASHGFTVGQPLRLSGSTYALAKADTEANAQVVAIVGAVISTGVFVALRAGIVSGLSGLTPGARYYLDAATAGGVTTSAPSLSAPVYDAITDTEAIAAVGSAGASPAPNLVLEVVQSAHGFTVGNVVTNTGVSWDLAVAGDDAVGVVCKVVDADTFWVCEWGIVCITGATFAESSVYYLGATAGTPTTTPGTPKRAVFFAVSPTMILVTNPAKDASGGGLDPITGPAVLGKADAGSGEPAAIAASANDTVLGRRAGVLTFAQIATAEIADDAVTADKLANTAVTPAAYGGALQVGAFTVDAQGRLTAAENVTVTPEWASILSKPTTLGGYGITDACSDAELAAHVGAADPHPGYRLESDNVPWTEVSGKPTYFDTQISSAANNTDTTDSGSLGVSGTANNTLLTLYEKRPRFNSKWWLGKPVGVSVGSVTGSSEAFLFAWWNKTAQEWGAFSLWGGATTIGDVLVYDPTAADTNGQMTAVRGGLANSVFGRAGDIDGLPASIVADEGTVMQRSEGSDISFSSDISIGTGHRTATATVGSIDIAISTDGDSVRISSTDAGIAIYDRSVSTSVPLIKIGVGHASLTSTLRSLQLREIDECDSSGVSKKRLYLCSEQY